MQAALDTQDEEELVELGRPIFAHVFSTKASHIEQMRINTDTITDAVLSVNVCDACTATNCFCCQPRSSRIKAPGASSEDELLLPFAWKGSSIEELFREQIFVGRYDFTMDYVTRTRASSVYTPVSPRSDSPCSGASGE